MENENKESKLINNSTLVDNSKSTQGIVYNNDFVNSNKTEQESIRDRQITNLLSKYVEFYSNNKKDNVKYKKILFVLLISVIIILTLGLIGLVVTCFIIKLDLAALISTLIASVISYLGSIFICIQSITKCLFPTNEDDNISKTVGVILNNDVENKKLNLQQQSKEEKTND